MTPESAVKTKVRRMLDQYRSYYHMPVQNGMGKPTLDFIGCHNGRFFAIETKAPGKKPTLRQEGTIREMQQAKGAAFVIDGSEDSFATFRMWLEMV